MNKAMLCRVKRKEEEKNILIIKNKIDPEAQGLKVDYQFEDTDSAVQQLISSQVGQELELDFLAGEESWQLSSKKMFISNFDYAYDLSSLTDFIDSLITFKANDREIDREIIQMLKDDIFSAAVFWENDTIDQDLTAELILKYWDLDPVQNYPDNDYYKKLMQFADSKLDTIDQETADFWFDIPATVRAKIKKEVESGKISYENCSVYLKTAANRIINTILLNFISEAAGESQESINNLFEKFHYQLIDELTKTVLEENKKLNLKPIIPHAGSERKDLSLQPDLKITEYSLLEIFDHYSIAVDFEALNLFSESSFKTLSDYLSNLITHLDFLNQMREKIKCESCGQKLDYELKYLSKYAVYKVDSARCTNLDCQKFDQEIKFD
ncbi:hypothetical protein C7957_10290 [Halanaerobium saccharolyticum]|uniref:Uncharacterized protein n=1 Tax=Halanaerobium saccharolyticum TaxID=43595 RepID=A0A4V3D016_9FIRM|nr:hypothetical protein [Halanaerobium saccharolyticum]TDQ03995.1 hypothetical protein C7957_10290 [Halanaerobium saccharolyticum]